MGKENPQPRIAHDGLLRANWQTAKRLIVPTFAGTLAIIGAACSSGTEKGISASEHAPLDLSSSSATPTPKSTETPARKEGILPVGNWQFEVQKWTESPYKPYGVYYPGRSLTEQYREGWKYVTVNGMIRNMGANIGRMDFNLVQFSFLSKDNSKYDAHNPKYGTYILPPGFTDSFFLDGWIPEIQNDYSLSIVSVSKDLSIPQNPKQGVIKKAEVTKDSPVISTEVVLNGIDKPWIIPNFGVVTYNNKTLRVQGDRLEDRDVNGKFHIYQYISLSLQNNTGQDIFPDSSFVIFLKNGDRISGERATRQGLETPTIPPGSKKSFYVYMPIGDTKTIDQEIKGGILVGFHGNGWFAWQLP